MRDVDTHKNIYGPVTGRALADMVPFQKSSNRPKEPRRAPASLPQVHNQSLEGNSHLISPTTLNSILSGSGFGTWSFAMKQSERVLRVSGAKSAKTPMKGWGKERREKTLGVSC